MNEFNSVDFIEEPESNYVETPNTWEGALTQQDQSDYDFDLVNDDVVTPEPQQEPTYNSEEAEIAKVEIDQKLVDFTIVRPCSEQVDSKEAVSETDISFLLENYRTVETVLELANDYLTRMKDQEFVTKPEDRDWYQALALGLHYVNNNGEAPTGALERDGAKWVQGIHGNDRNQLLRPGRVTQRLEKNKRYTKEELSTYLSRKSGGGGTFDVMLPTSGLWLRLREPTLSEVIGMLTDIDQITVKAGMQTKGLMFSNSTAIPAMAITNLALNCVIDANVNFTTPSDLEELVSALDEPILHHGLAAVMHPEGFEYRVPCIADVKNCSAVISYKINMASIFWADDIAFTAVQRKLWARRLTRKSSLEELKEYREEFSIGSDKIYWFQDIGVKLSIPNLYQRRQYVEEWIDSLTQMTSGAFNEAADGPRRRAYIDRLNEATKASQFAQWVSGIYERNDDLSESEEQQLVSDDEEVIREYLLDTLSRDTERLNGFFDAITKFSNDSLIGIIALPSHECPSCKGTQGSVLNERFPHLVPIDVLPVFFTLAGRKVQHLMDQ